VTFRGKEITAHPPREITRLGIARAFQVPQLFLEHTVIECMLMAAASRIRHRNIFQSLHALAERAEMLALLAEQLGQVPNHLSIEGHTDSQPFIGKRDYGNWELSSDRANSARRLMQQKGLGDKQVAQVRGYADQLLRKTDSPMDPSNRRISLIVKYTDQQDQEQGGNQRVTDCAQGAKSGRRNK